MPILGVIFGFAFLFVVTLVALNLRFRRRLLEHTERMAAMEKGLAFPDAGFFGQAPSPWDPRMYMLRGMIWSLAGVGMMIALAGISLTVHRTPSAEERVYQWQRLRGMGATEQQMRQADDDMAERGRIPLAFCLVGLVPLGVGVAYLMFSTYSTMEWKGHDTAARDMPAMPLRK